MIWIILTILFIVFGFVFEKEINFFFAYFTVGVTIIIAGFGFTTYPLLIGQNEEIIVLRERINDIRSAVYETKDIKGAIVSGSIENMEQSKVLSESIQYLSKREGDYNSNLKQIQYYENSSIIFWVWHGMFISHNVQDLNLIVINRLKRCPYCWDDDHEKCH